MASEPSPAQVERQRYADEHFGGDLYHRVFNGDRAQCGCYWAREPGFGDVLHQCPLHQAHTESGGFDGE